MTYIVKQKIRGRIYAYEAENFWDSEKKQSRQKRRYLGVWDEVEKKFDELKNELDIIPLRVQKIETLQGLIFIFFISLILRAMLLRRARDAELLDKNSIEEIIMELAKLRAVKVGEKWRLTEVSKKQRTIFEKLKITIPVEANLVIKKSGV